MNRPSFRSLSRLVVGALLLWSIPGAGAQTIPQGEIVVDLEAFATIPTSGGGQPPRVNVLRSAPDSRLFANDQRGIIYLISADGATVTPYLDLTQYVPLLADNGERGFQSFVFHPDFNRAGAPGYGKFYTMGSQSDTTATATFAPNVAGAGRDHDEVLLEWTAADPAAATFVPADGTQPFREVLRIARPNSNHNAGYLSFNPTAGTGGDRGKLYLGTGDSGGGGDPLGLAQMLGKVYGSILRINPLLPAADDPQQSANGQYSIPSDNPYYINAPDFLPEKYAAGFRNPQRFTWDSANGQMFIADIGQGKVEEIDLGVAGANYGWNQREGSYVFTGGAVGASVRDDAATTGFIYPVAEYFHYGSNGNAVTTGPVYRGSGVPQLMGRLIFSDFVNGVPYTLDADNPGDGGQGPITELRLRSGGVEMSFLAMIQQVAPSATRADLRYGTDADGNVYFLNKQDGVIRRIVAPALNGPTVRVSTTTPVISRASGARGVLIFTRTGDLSAPLNFSYSVASKLVAGLGYVPLRGVKTFLRGNGSAYVPIIVSRQGKNGALTITVQPGDGYTPDAGTQSVRVQVIQ